MSHSGGRCVDVFILPNALDKKLTQPTIFVYYIISTSVSVFRHLNPSEFVSNNPPPILQVFVSSLTDSNYLMYVRR